MKFQWDDDKNAKNLDKHGISFDLASWVFVDPLAVSRKDLTTEDEERWQLIGHAQGVQLLLVVYTTRDDAGEDVVRIISARKATGQERKEYENGTWFA